MILIIDNYDSFTHNLVQALGGLGAEVRVVRNDAATAPQIEAMAPDRLLISPGPGAPRDSGVSVRAVRRLAGRVPILGVCLGMQCIAAAFGGRVVRAPRIMHGKTSPVLHDGAGVLRGLPSPFDAMRYHSLIVDESRLPDGFDVTARTLEGEPMAIRHRDRPIEGVQFHPESYRTPSGPDLLRRWLDA